MKKQKGMGMIEVLIAMVLLIIALSFADQIRTHKDVLKECVQGGGRVEIVYNPYHDVYRKTCVKN